MHAINLKTEYLQNPLGLGIVQPRFYWNCTGGQRQTAYRVTAKRGGELVWDSGKVASGSMTHIAYAGKPLHSRDHIDWTVELWDENDVLGEKASAWFELGLLQKQDWTAKWISGAYRPQKNHRYPVDCFLKEFASAKPVAQARLYITACGVYEAALNGTRVGDFILAPGSTDYRKRIQYQTYDVTALLQPQNRFEVLLADGWYRGSIGCFGQTSVFGRQTKLLCQMEITYTDGTRQQICSDETFAWNNDGPIRFADLKDGEIVNAAMRPSYCGHAVVTEEAVVPTASDNVPVTSHEVFIAKKLTTPSGKTVLDFGQNIAGQLAFTVHGKKGQRVRLTCGEILDENGEFTQKNFQVQRPAREYGKLTELLLITGNAEKLRTPLQPTPLQQVVFYCSGGQDEYRTKFAVFGFRYALLETEAEYNAEDFKAVAVYSDLEQTGSFRCSSEKINRLYQNVVWSMKGNYLDVPTDCPTRERLAWTGDAQVFFDTGAYLMNTAPFFRKWLRDMADGQFKNGKISAVTPYNGASMVYDNTGTSAGWADAAILVPYRYWKRYGDRKLLEQCYPMMRRSAQYMLKNTGHKDKKAAKANPYNRYVYEKGVQLGEWLEPKEFLDTDNHAGAKLQMQTEVATAYMHYSMACMAEMARELEQEEDAVLFAEYADGAKKAYEHLFLANGAPDTDRQAKLVRPLALGLAEGKTKKAIEQRLSLAVERRGGRIGTGFLSTPFVLRVLTEAGRADLAYKMLENEQQPSWLYEVNHGATTIWEDWEGLASHNHYSSGSVAQWLFDTVCGIRQDGENHFVISPMLGGSLRFAAAEYRSLYGIVRASWEKTESGTTFTVEIPANCTAQIVLPNGQKENVEAGSYQFTVKGEYNE